MAQEKRARRNSYRKFEQLLTRVIIGTVVVFVLMLAAAAIGIGWLRGLLAACVLIVSGLGVALLYLKREHRRRRSRWMLAAFAALAVCTLVSLLVGYPAPSV